MTPMEKNTDENIWRGDHVVYLARGDIYRFETNEKDTEAWYTADIPENAESFSLSLKIGNSYSAEKPGYQDYAVVTVGYNSGSGSFEMLQSPYIQNEQKYIVLSLGNEQSPVELWAEADRLFIKIEAHNAADDEMDVFFGEPCVTFYDRGVSNEFISEYHFYDLYRFEITETDQNVFHENSMILPAILLFLFAVGIRFFHFWKREKERQ